MNLSDLLYNLDVRILHLINVDWQVPLLDPFWRAISHLEREWWFMGIILPLILFRLVYIYRARAVIPLLMVGLAVGVSDALSYRVIKGLVQRHRPFENPDVARWIRHIGDAHGPSFPSNHATNCFAAAVILAWYFPWGRELFYIFALLVGVSRITLGVHYPSDVAAGAALGIFVGFLIRIFLLYRFKFLRLKKSVSSSNGDSYSWRKRIRRLEQD